MKKIEKYNMDVFMVFRVVKFLSDISLTISWQLFYLRLEELASQVQVVIFCGYSGDHSQVFLKKSFTAVSSWWFLNLKGVLLPESYIFSVRIIIISLSVVSECQDTEKKNSQGWIPVVIGVLRYAKLTLQFLSKPFKVRRKIKKCY